MPINYNFRWNGHILRKAQFVQTDIRRNKIHGQSYNYSKIRFVI